MTAEDLGTMLVFFRVAYEADGSAHLEYGHYEHSDDGLLLELANGEWPVVNGIVDGIFSPKRRTREYRR